MATQADEEPLVVRSAAASTNLFTQWIETTGELEKFEGRAPTVEDLKSEIRKRLKQFLAKKA